MPKLLDSNCYQVVCLCSMLCDLNSKVILFLFLVLGFEFQSLYFTFFFFVFTPCFGI